MTQEYNVEQLLDQLGKTGKYQYFQHFLHCYCAFLAGMHMFSLTFVAPTPKHRCYVPSVDLLGGVGNNGSGSPLFDALLLSPHIPLKGNGEMELDSCHRYSLDDVSTIEACNGQFVYDTSIYQESRVVDWDMVCENKWKRAFIQSMYVLGVFTGALFCGSIADRIGRKKVLCFSGLMQFVIALSQPYFQNFWLYSLSLWFYGMFGSAGAYITGYVLTMELIHKSNRTTYGVRVNSSFAVGASLCPIYAYFVGDIWLLQTIYAVHALPVLAYWWVMDESIRWLWSQGRIHEAVKVARKAARTNGLEFFSPSMEGTTKAEKEKESEKSSSSGLLDLVSFPVMRCRLLITAFTWFATSLCYYGLAFNTGNLPGNPYFVFLITALADLPGFWSVAFLANKTGRRSLNSFLLLCGGVACIAIALMSKGIFVTVLAFVAKFAAAGAFTLIYFYTAELFPTTVRNSAVGVSTMAARLAGTLTPQISLLDSLGKSLPTLIFGGLALCAAFAFLFLPETLNKELPQTVEDGENYGIGDTAFAKRKGKKQMRKEEPAVSEKMLPC